MKKVKTIQRIDYLSTSSNANPRYLITFTDGESAKTETDGSVNYGITNPEFKHVPVEFTFDNRGNITHARPVKEH